MGQGRIILRKLFYKIILKIFSLIVKNIIAMIQIV
jgi:hypothetical protein